MPADRAPARRRQSIGWQTVRSCLALFGLLLSVSVGLDLRELKERAFQVRVHAERA
jgi:hypothetical protein